MLWKEWCSYSQHLSTPYLICHHESRLDFNHLHPKKKKIKPYRLSFHKVVDCCSYEPHTPFHVLDVTLSTSLFMFHLISFSPYFIVHVSSYFLQSTLHWSCLIFISFSPQSISYISPTTVHLVHVYLIWLYLYYMVIQPHCQFHFSANPVSGN